MGRQSIVNSTLDVVLTGKRIDSIIKQNKCSVKELQEILNLSCPQSIYRWIREEELWNKFETDRPKILGCIFKILAVALNDKEPIEKQDLIRMADFHVACIKVGRVLGMMWSAKGLAHLPPEQTLLSS